MSKSLKAISTPNAPQALGPYSQAVSDGDTLYVSGQLPLDPATGQFVEGDIRVQTHRVLDSLEAILKAGGSSLEHVVRVDIFLKDLSNFAAVNEEYAKRFSYAVKPARQTVQAVLPKNADIEISCIAKIR